MRPAHADRSRHRLHTVTFSLTALSLVVVSSLGWSGFDLLRKMLVERIPPMALLLALTVGQIPLFAAWLWWQPTEVEAAYWLPALASVGLNVLANTALIVAMKRSPLFVTIPLLSLIPALTTLLAVPLLGEIPGLRRSSGILLVVAGALLLNLGRVPGRGFLRALVQEPGSVLMLVVAVAWSLALPLDKLALRAANGAFHGLFLTGGVSVGVLAVMAVRREIGQIGTVRRAPGLAVLAVAVSSLALGFQLLAIEIVWVGLVETLKRGIGNFMALVWGRFLLAEAVTPWSVTAVLLMAIGVGLAAL